MKYCLFIYYYFMLFGLSPIGTLSRHALKGLRYIRFV
jgi:hypothetical protein